MWRRILAGALGAFGAVNSLAMLIEPAGWFARVPGAADTGPFNMHFVQDVGLAFLAASLGLCALAWRATLWPAALAGSAFLVFHALLHLWGLAHGHSRTAVFDLVAIVAPAALALFVSWPRKGDANA
jgi:hypothetical protein